MSQFSLVNLYEKVTKNIIRCVIRKLSSGVHLAHGICDGKLPNMYLDSNLKQEKNPDGTLAVDDDEYKLQVLEWKENAKIYIERKRNGNGGNQKLYTILVNHFFLLMCSKLEGTTGNDKVRADQNGISLLSMITNIV